MLGDLSGAFEERSLPLKEFTNERHCSSIESSLYGLHTFRMFPECTR